ncbi:hypothetical protein LguiA_014649 [Lonicera macranthoides]
MEEGGIGGSSSTIDTTEAKVKSIFIYPVKSCLGISLSQAPLTPTGFRWDREWVVVNSNGKAFSQKFEPKLALIEVELPNEAFCEGGWEPSNDSFLVINAPGMETLKVSLSRAREISVGVSVGPLGWEWSGSALDEGDESSNWFSDFLGKPSRLLRFNKDSESRPVNAQYAPGFNVMFSDGFPFHLLSQGSMDELNKLLKDPVSVNRFRPNILVDGCEPFSEDLWKEIRINNLKFQSVMLCPRCKVITINQENAIPGREPNETLKKFRADTVLSLNLKQGKVYFGQFLVCKESPNAGEGKIIEVGDPIFVDKVVSSYADVTALLS